MRRRLIGRAAGKRVCVARRFLARRLMRGRGRTAARHVAVANRRRGLMRIATPLIPLVSAALVTAALIAALSERREREEQGRKTE